MLLKMISRKLCAGDAKNAHLSECENASTNLRLFKAELLDYDSICSAVEGCIGVFHVASPVPVPKTTVPNPEARIPIYDFFFPINK